ncbi:MAG: DUF2064 domain-containing protein [Actinomycetota bacterium]|nr:DUF2064 domain-containing protein [Actinomycetota bacterium]
MATIVVIAKEPVPGRVKTRLVPPLSFEQAAAVAAASLADTLTALTDLPAHRRVIALEGASGPWLPVDWDVTTQSSGQLDARLTAALIACGHAPAILVGMDTPQIRAADLTVFDPVAFDACLGLSSDGGYWAIGFRDPGLARRVIPGVAMSVQTTGAEQLQRLDAAGLRVQLLEVLQDVDTFHDALQVAALVPHSRFAGVVSGVRGLEVAGGR